MIRRMTGWALAGSIAGIVIGAVDAARLYLDAAMFFDSGEMHRTMLMASAMVAGAGVLIGLTVGIAARAHEVACRPGAFLGHGRRPILATGLALVPFSLVPSWLLTEGPRIAASPARPFLVFGGSIAVSLAAAWAVTAGSRIERLHGRILIAIACAVMAALAHIADLFVLVRLYPVFHLALSAATLVLGTLCVAALVRPSSTGGRARAITGSLLAAACLVCGWRALDVAFDTQNARYVIAQRTATAADVLAIATSFAGRPAPCASIAITPVEESPVDSEGGLSLPRSPVILLTVDAMRADRLGLFANGKRRPAPNLDALAADSVVFERAYTPIPHTSHAVTSLLTGKYVAPLFDVPGAPETHETLADILGRFRYETAAFFTKAVFFIDRARFEPYYRTRYGFQEARIEYDTAADDLAEATLEFLREREADGAAFFVWTHFFEPHEPYDPGCTRFGEDAEARYDCEIAVADEAAGRIIAFARSAFPSAIIVATADHGEEFGDHGGRYHGTTLHDEQVRVPLVVRAPGIGHRVVSQPVNLVDLVGTILAALDIPVPSRVRSRDLGSLMTGTDAKTRAFSQVHDQVMVVEGAHKLIVDREAGISSLYDLAADPLETRSVADAHPDLVARLEGLIASWEATHKIAELRPVDTVDGPAAWPPEIRRVLSGDTTALDALVPIISSDAPLVVRRKAAELVAGAWDRRPSKPLHRAAEDPDPEIAAWIAIARSAANDEPEALRLGQRMELLEPMSPAWRAVATRRLAAGDLDAAEAVSRIIADASTPEEQRLEGIGLLGEHRIRAAADVLLAHIDEYPLALAISKTLAALKDRRAVPILIARLKRERFPERRAVVCEALAAFGDKRARRPIAGELARTEPAPFALAALVDMHTAPLRGALFASDDGAAKIHVVSGERAWVPAPPFERVTRVVALTESSGDGRVLEVSCNGTVAGDIPLAGGGRQQGHADLESCAAWQGGKAPTLSLRVIPADAPVSLLAVATVGR